MENDTTTSRKLKPVTPTEAKQQELTNATKRFIEEIDRICLEGRVNSITQLEKDIGLRKGKLAEYDRRNVWVDIVTLALAKRVYNIDVNYVLFGVADPELSGPVRMGKRLDIYKPINRRERKGRKTR